MFHTPYPPHCSLVHREHDSCRWYFFTNAYSRCISLSWDPHLFINAFLTSHPDAKYLHIMELVSIFIMTSRRKIQYVFLPTIATSTALYNKKYIVLGTLNPSFHWIEPFCTFRPVTSFKLFAMTNIPALTPILSGEDPNNRGFKFVKIPTCSPIPYRYQAFSKVCQ